MKRFKAGSCGVRMEGRRRSRWSGERSAGAEQAQGPDSSTDMREIHSARRSNLAADDEVEYVRYRQLFRWSKGSQG